MNLYDYLLSTFGTDEPFYTTEISFGDYSKPIYLPKSQIKVLNGYVVAVKGWLVANKGLESLLLREASANLDTYHLQVLA